MFLAAVLAVTSFAALSVAAPAGPAGAAPQPFTLTMAPGEGQVFVGDNPEPLEIGDPTIIAGTVDDLSGAITGASFATPSISFTQQITSPVVADVFLTASFAEVNPGSGTGVIDGLGNVSVSSSLRLNLHIVVGDPVIMVGNCVSSPITLNLVSVDPYDPETGRVALADPRFAIPPVSAGGSCPDIMAESVNEQLASPNNRITMELEGELPLPPPPGEPSSVSLVSAAPSTQFGQPATFVATVEPDGATGSVRFSSGSTVLGVAPVVDGEAEFTTTGLQVGTHQIVARYSGDSDHQPSTSAPVTHTVTAIPHLNANLPLDIRAGAAPTEFTVTVTNPASGQDQDGLRIDMLYGRVGSATTLTAAMLTLEYRDGTDWVAVPLARRTTPPPADLTGTLAGNVGGPDGFALAAGETREITFRIAASANAVQGSMAVQFRFNAVDDGAVTTTFGTFDASVLIVGATRRPTTTAMANVPPVEIRQGFTLTINRFGGDAFVTRGGPTPLPSITPAARAEVLINGVPVPVRRDLTVPLGSTVPVASTGVVTFQVPPSVTRDLAPGAHRISVRFLGDALYQASLSPEATFIVHAQAQPAYECSITAIGAVWIQGAHVDVYATLPAAAPAGATVTARSLDVRATIEDVDTIVWTMAFMFDNPFDFVIDEEEVLLAFTPEGSTGSYTGMEAGATTTSGPIEAPLSLVEPTLEIPIQGDPGDVIDIDLEAFGYTQYASDGSAFRMNCAPVGEEMTSLGQIVVAGTTVTSSAVGPVEQGNPVALSAAVHPATAQGMVEFFDGATSLGFAPVSNGQATLTTTGLPVGERSITARYLGDLVNAPTTSASEIVTIREVILCRSQAVEGNGAVVRSTYLHLLGRCPELAGYVHWVGQLNAGLPAETFARQVASSLEAHGRSVDDGYQLILGRNADASGRAFWAQRLNSGQRYDALLGDLAASNEFWTAAGSTNNGYVTRLYDRLLHRAPDTAGLNYWVGRLSAGQSRASVAASFVRLPEPSGQIVSDAYRSILDRGPTAGERTPAVTAFQGDGHRWRIYASLIGTEEFFDRSQTFPNP